MKSKLLVALTTAFITMGAVHSTIAKADNGWSSQNGNGSSWHGGNGQWGQWGWGYTPKYLIARDNYANYTKCYYVYVRTYNNKQVGPNLYVSYYFSSKYCPKTIY